MEFYGEVDRAKTETSKASAKEKVQVAVMGSFDNKGNINNSELKTNLDNVEGIDKTTVPGIITDDTYPFTVIVDGHEVTIEKSGNVTIKGENSEPPAGDTVKPGEIVTGGNKKYTNNGTAVIPEGFAIVPGCEDVSKGLVISDDAGDTEIDSNNIVANGNQFVWIPVDNKDNFKTEDGYYMEKKQTWVSSNICTEPYKNANQEEKDLYTAMYNSVTNENNKGFYIGRYEAGEDSDGSVVSKKNMPVYDNIRWSNSETMTVLTGGAVELSRDFVKTTYTNKGKAVGVNSTLVYGVQWDATLRFFNDEDYFKNSTGKGWYEDNYAIGNPNHLTGINIDTIASNKVKNIYDMAGNVSEWTMEAYSSYDRVYRGGSYQNDGNNLPVSHRFDESPFLKSVGIGFRVALYLSD